MINKREDLVVKLGCLFYFCSILGFIYELILNYISTGKVFSHGILNGPWLPIYGTGALLIMNLYKLRKKPFLVFGLSFFITGFLELVCGYILLKFFKMRLWDYTGKLFNINGFVCLLSAFCFGIGGILIIYLFFPLIDKLVKKFNIKFFKIILIILTIIFCIDILLTIF